MLEVTRTVPDHAPLNFNNNWMRYVRVKISKPAEKIALINKFQVAKTQFLHPEKLLWPYQNLSFFTEVNAEVNRENPNSVKLQTNNNEIKHFFSIFFWNFRRKRTQKHVWCCKMSKIHPKINRGGRIQIFVDRKMHNFSISIGAIWVAFFWNLRTFLEEKSFKNNLALKKVQICL